MSQSAEGSTVYFLGAGASKSFYPVLPLATELTLRHLIEWQYKSPGPDAERDRIHQWIDSGHDELADKPIEESLVVIQSHHHLYVDVQACILTRLSLREEARDPELQSWLMRVAHRREAIITLNYDNVIEWNLIQYDNANRGVNGALDWLDYGVPTTLCAEDSNLWFGHRGEKRVQLLKLHGSTGWTKCLGTCKKYRLDPIAGRSGAEAVQTPHFPIWLRCSCGGDPWAVIEPPQQNKQYADPLLQLIRKRASEALRNARVIVFAGFSASSADEQVLSLFRESRETSSVERIVVVNRQPEPVMNTLAQIYPGIVECGGHDWKKFLTGEGPPGL